MGLYNTISIMNTGINDSCRPEYAAVVKKDADDGSEVTMNLRSDDRFVEDEGWQSAAVEYELWVTAHQNKHVLYLEIGVGWNTPVFYSMRTKGKSMRNAIKRQISEGSHTWIKGFERRCA